MIQFMIKNNIPIYQIQNTEMQVQKYKYSNTKVHKYKVQERPGMCYILKKHMLQGFISFTPMCQVQKYRNPNTPIHKYFVKYRNTQIQTHK